MNIPSELIEALALIKETPTPTIEYRIYYDNNGSITECSMVNHSEKTNYITVDKETYDNYFRYDKVIDGKLRKIVFDPGYRVQLHPSKSGYKVVKNHAALLIEDYETYDNTEFYNGTSN